MISPPPPATDRHAPRRPEVWDWLVAAIAAALSLWVLARSGQGPGFRAADPLAFVLTAAGAAALAWGRSRALLAVTVASLAGTALAFHNVHVDVLPFALTALLFSAGSYLPRRTSIAAFAVAAAALALTITSHPADLGPAEIAQTYSIFLIAWLLGRLVRGRRLTLLELVAAAEARAATERALTAAERDRAVLVRVEERLRIARELHDILAHSISVISVQATVGEHLATTEPRTAQQSLATIGSVARSSMQELRQLVTVLRDESQPAGSSVLSSPVPYEPAHDLGDLGDLVATFASAGLQVTASTTGTARPLTPSAQLSAYRIVQESLTNTLKHAGKCTAKLELAYQAEALQICVTDDGAGPKIVVPVDDPPRGHGLIGMRERTLLLDGTFSAGPVPTGGFAVRATIPYPAA